MARVAFLFEQKKSNFRFKMQSAKEEKEKKRKRTIKLDSSSNGAAGDVKTESKKLKVVDIISVNLTYPSMFTRVLYIFSGWGNRNPL